MSPGPITPMARLSRASALLGLPLAAYGLSGALLSRSDWTLCTWQYFTGLPCPLCGGTHAVYHLLRLEVVPAFEANAAVAVMVLAFALAGLCLGLESMAGRSLPASMDPRRWLPLLMRLQIVLLALNWMAAIYRT